MSALPVDAEKGVISWLDAVDQIKLASVCRASRNLGMSESAYVREVKSRFSTTFPTFSGVQLTKYRSLGLVLPTGERDRASYWFR